MPDGSILVINTGSSSLKFGLYSQHQGEEHVEVDGSADGIGKDSGKIEIKDAYGKILRSEKLNVPSQADALDHASQWLASLPNFIPIAIGHRVVHGGPHLVNHQPITPALIEELKRCVHFAPLHIPAALELINKAAKSFPHIPQFACFDTAFHQHMPIDATMFPLPAGLFNEGVRRYGFHGLSYESIVHQLGQKLPEKTVIAHLGSGASLAAVRNGVSVDTSMGLTPTGGIPMATRSGDLDPGVLLYLLRAKKIKVDVLESLLNNKAGLIGISDGTSDMRDLETKAARGDAQATLAIDIFCRSIRKTIAAYSAVLEGIDLLVFSGGIGENSAQVRREICRGLEFLGISIDDSANRLHSTPISTDKSRVRVQVVPSKEDFQIARHCRQMMQQGA